LKPEKLWVISREKNTRLILALDKELPFLTLDRLEPYLYGIKIGLPLFLEGKIDYIKELIKKYKNTVYMLADVKLADIPEIVSLNLRLLGNIGFDGAITHLFQGGIHRVKKETDLIGIILMSHSEASRLEFFLRDMVKEGEDAGLDGFIVGFSKLKMFRNITRERTTVLTPGIGVQGGEYGEGLKEGADFEIIGRSIVNSEDPLEETLKIVKAERRALGQSFTS